MQYHLMVFETEDHKPFRTLEFDGEPWFVLADVCRALGLQGKDGYYGHYAERLDDDERRVVPRSAIDAANPPLMGEGRIPGGPTLTVISESGLYALIIRSRLPNAKRFRKWVTSEVLPSIRRTGAYRAGRKTPAFIRRFNDNWDRVSPGYFSVISELVIRLHGRLEMVGHLMADKGPDGKELRPDVSVGKRFADWLRQFHETRARDHAFYMHKAAEGEFEAREYPRAMLPLYIEYVDDVWIPRHSEEYFRTRDPKALAYLPMLLPMAHKSRPALPRRPGERPRFIAPPRPLPVPSGIGKRPF